MTRLTGPTETGRLAERFDLLSRGDGSNTNEYWYKMPIQLEALDVVVADDDERMRVFHRAVLEMIGISRVREARDGREAFEMICTGAPDLLITDYGMEPEDGIDLTLSVRDDSRSPDHYLPVIMVTAYTDSRRIGLARDAGVNGLLHKPVSPRELTRSIADTVGDPRPFIRTRYYFGPDRRANRNVLVRSERRAPTREPAE